METSPTVVDPQGSERSCPVCGAASVRRVGSLHGLPLVHCARCGHDRLATQGADLESFYDTHYSGFREDPVFAARVREVLQRSIAPRLPRRGPVLDVGCGNGEFLLAAAEIGLTPLGIDFSEAAARACSGRGVRAVTGDFLTHDFSADRPFQLISMWDVAEHLDKPFEFMQRAHELLAPGGLLVLKVPCFTRRTLALVRRVPRLAGPILGSPHHVQYFRPQGLEHLLRRAGFARVHVETLAAGMRGRRPAANVASSAKRHIIGVLNRYCGNANALVIAEASA